MKRNPQVWKSELLEELQRTKDPDTILRVRNDINIAELAIQLGASSVDPEFGVDITKAGVEIIEAHATQ